jgi:hypothetical protein
MGSTGALVGCAGGRAGADTDADAGSDDAPFVSLPERLIRADEVILGETLSEDRSVLTLRILVAAKGRLGEGETLTLPHPRLATTEGFVRFPPKSRYVYVLFQGVDEAWRTVESGELSTFPVQEGQVLVPAFYEPGAALPASGPPLHIPLDAFVGLVGVCREGDEQACRNGFAEAIAAGRESQENPAKCRREP